MDIIATNGISQNVPLRCLRQCKEGWESRHKTESTLVCVACTHREHYHTLTLQGPRSHNPSVSQGHVTSPTSQHKVQAIRQAD